MPFPLLHTDTLKHRQKLQLHLRVASALYFRALGYSKARFSPIPCKQQAESWKMPRVGIIATAGCATSIPWSEQTVERGHAD